MGGIFGFIRGVIIIAALSILLRAVLPDSEEDLLDSAVLMDPVNWVAEWIGANFERVLEAEPTEAVKDTIDSRDALVRRFCMCGLVGMVAERDVAADIYDALTMLQHRGQDAAGIMTCQDGKLMQRKGEGLVRDVFRASHMAQLLGQFGIGHVRYPTQGSSSTALAQPFCVNSPYGIALAHNGNLTNSAFLSEELFKSDL